MFSVRFDKTGDICMYVKTEIKINCKSYAIISITDVNSVVCSSL